MRTIKPLTIYPLLSFLSFGAFIFHLWFNRDGRSHESIHNSTPSQPQFTPDEASASSKPLQPPDYDSAVRNSTLGFEKVFVLNLPSRGDRLDAFVLSSSLTGFDVEVAPGIDGSTVPDSSLPSLDELPKDKHQRDGVVGTWRAHLNIARTIVHRRLSSALIMEDDADWDVTFKDRLSDFAAGSRYFHSKASDQPPRSPYGDTWDMLWLGHCSLEEHTRLPRPHERFLIENDPSVPRPNRRMNLAGVPDMSEYSNTTRAVFPTNFGICLYSYALSYSGAQKVLRAQAVRKKWAHIDLAMGHMCNSTSNDFKCIGVFPQIVDTHKAAGSWDRDSNIGVFSHDTVREHAYTANIIQSTRVNIDHLLAGKETVRQWTEDGPPQTWEGGVRTRVVEAPPPKKGANKAESVIPTDEAQAEAPPPFEDANTAKVSTPTDDSRAGAPLPNEDADMADLITPTDESGAEAANGNSHAET